MISRRKIRPAQLALAVVMIAAGILHFTHDEIFVSMVPDYLPRPLALVYLSGIAEAALGALLLVERTRRLAAWGLIALFIAVFPANLHWALHPDLQIAGAPDFKPGAVALWLRLPLQLVLIGWAWLYTRERPADLT